MRRFVYALFFSSEMEHKDEVPIQVSPKAELVSDSATLPVRGILHLFSDFSIFLPFDCVFDAHPFPF